jgi:protein-disulfide isomerase
MENKRLTFKITKFLQIFAVAGILLTPALLMAQETGTNSSAQGTGANSSAQPSDAKLPLILIKSFVESGSKVEYMGNTQGLDGWIVTSPTDNNAHLYAYTTPEGAMITGMLFAPDGSSETARQVKAFQDKLAGSQAATPGAEKSSLKSEKLYAESEAAGWVALGDASAPYLYMFMNVNCDHCQAFWKDLQDIVKAGKLQVRLIPFGKEPMNRDGGAALLALADTAPQAWQAYVDGDKNALSKDKATADSYAKLDANNAMVKQWAFKGTPFTLYRRPSDGKITAIVGKPENPLLLQAEFLKKVGG